MTTPHEAWTLRRLLIGHTLNGELQAISEPYRGVALTPTARLLFPADAGGGSPAESRLVTLTYWVLSEMRWAQRER